MEGYKKLTTYILATIIYDLTTQFCKQFLAGKRRQIEQMEQVFDSEGLSPQAQTRRAARSGKQNIAEGYTFQSLEGYIKLCGVAEGSIKEWEVSCLKNKLILLGKNLSVKAASGKTYLKEELTLGKKLGNLS